MILTRTLTTRQLGTWGLFLIVTGIFEATKTNLLKNAHVKFVSGAVDEMEKIKIASASFLINAIANMLYIVLIIFVSGWLSYWLNEGQDLKDMLYWFIPGMVFLVFFTHLETIQLSNLDFKGIFAGYFIRQAFFLTTLVVHIIFNEPITLVRIAFYQSVSIGLGSVALYLYAKKYLSYKYRPGWYWSRKILGYGGYIFGSGVVANVANNLDQLMIARYIPGYVAYYNVAARINNLVDMPSYAAADVIFPKAAIASSGEDPARVKYLFEKMVSILLSITLPIAITIILLPKLITGLVAGREYFAAAGILQIYMISGILRPAQNQAANLLNSIGRPGVTFLVNTISLSMLVALNYFLLKSIGFYGAAIGTLLTTLTGFVIWYFVMRRQINLEMGNIGRYMIDNYRLAFSSAKAVLVKFR